MVNASWTFSWARVKAIFISKIWQSRAILTIWNIAQKKRFDDKVTITQTNVDDSQPLFCTCRSHYHRN